MKTSILILCTGNSCRSQIAEAILKSLDKNLELHSAGTEPALKVHPKAIKVMKEIGLDIGANVPKNVNQFLNRPFDYVITVCDHANETCPVFTGKVRHRLHMGFDDPAAAHGTEEQIVKEFRRVRNEIKFKFEAFYRAELKSLSK